MTGSLERGSLMNEPSGPVDRATVKSWAGLATVLLATFMGQIDMFIVNVAAPGIQARLGASFGQLQFIINGYVIAYAAGMITGGRIGDRWGRRRVLWCGAAAFTVASLLCALAPTPTLLIASRVVQGLAASVLMPQVLSLIRAEFTTESQRARAVGAYGATIGLGVIGGLIGGGLLMHLDLAGLGWRGIFVINVPIGLVILVATPLLVLESRASAPPRTDFTGALLTGLALPAALLPLALGSEAGWPTWSWISAIVGLLLLIAFVAQQRALARRGGEPIVPPRLFANRGFWLSMITVAAFFSSNAGLFLVLTYHLQAGLGCGPLATGLAFTPLGVGFAVASVAGRRLANRSGPRVATVGACLMATGLVLVPAVAELPVSTHVGVLAAVIGLSGFGQGLVVAQLLSTVLTLIRADEAGAGSGVFNTVTQAGMALGVAAIGTLYRGVLGTNPDMPSIPLDTGDFTIAFDIVSVALAVLAAITAVLLARLHRGFADSADPPQNPSPTLASKN